jgi:hypothetical protein
MDYNDIIIISLLVIIIGIVLFKKDLQQLTHTEGNITPYNYRFNQVAQIPYGQIPQLSRQPSQINYQEYKPQLNYKQNYDMNKKLEKIKNNKQKSLMNKNIKQKFNIDENNSIDEKNSLDEISLNKKSNLKKKIIKKQKKVVIDDYSEFDNIKSLGGLDNTLSDIVSIVDKN